MSSCSSDEAYAYPPDTNGAECEADQTFLLATFLYMPREVELIAAVEPDIAQFYQRSALRLTRCVLHGLPTGLSVSYRRAYRAHTHTFPPNGRDPDLRYGTANAHP